MVCDELASNKINIIALTLMDSVEHGVFRLVAENVEKARRALTALNLPMTETQVLAVEMPNRPGAVADFCGRLNGQHIRIRYAYVTSGAAGGRTVGIFKVDNLKKAVKVAGTKPAGRKPRKVVRVSRAARSK